MGELERWSAGPPPAPTSPDYLDPLEGGRFSVVRRWASCYDYDGDVGGFRSGEFLLRSDGVVLDRPCSSLTGRDGTRWQAGPWVKYSLWSDVRECAGRLQSGGYDLYEPSPVPIDADRAGPRQGWVPEATPARDLQ